MKQLKLTCLIVLFMYSGKMYAQSPDTSTTQKLLQYIFQNVDKAQVPTGFLEEYGAPIIPMETFNGTLTDSNRIDMNLWRTLYFQLQTSYCQAGTNLLPAITTVNTTIQQNASANSPIPIPLLIGQYNTVSSTAFSNNLLSYNSNTNQVYDVAGRTQSPYQLNNLFAACPDRKQTLTGIDSFICSSNMIWNATGKSISQIQIDFANGQGLQTLTIGTPIGVSYSDTGYKRWTIKVTLTDNTVLQCYSGYYVLKTNGGARYFSNQTIKPAWGDINIYSGAKIYVNYSRKSYTGTLRKPLIVVEGYDVSHVAPDLQSNYNSQYFIDVELEGATPYDFKTALDNGAGYDLVFVNFNDGTDDIKNNAAIVEEVIRRVNANKVNDDRFGNIRQQNVVMG